MEEEEKFCQQSKVVGCLLARKIEELKVAVKGLIIVFKRCDGPKSFQKDAINSSVKNDNLKLCCGTDCCTGFPENATDDSADKEEIFEETAIQFWIIVMGVLMATAFFIHCVCMTI